MATLIGINSSLHGGCKGSSGGGSVQKTLRPLKTVGAKKSRRGINWTLSRACTCLPLHHH